MLVLNARVRIVDQLAFGHDGKHLYAAGTWHGKHHYQWQNRGIDLWELSGVSEPQERLFPTYLVHGIVPNPAGGWLYVSADQDHLSRDGESGYFAVELENGNATWLGLNAWNLCRIAIHPSGSWFVGFGCVTNWLNTRVIRWRQPAQGLPEREWERTPGTQGERPWELAYEPDGVRIAALEGEYQRDRGWVRQLVFRDPANWAVQCQLPLPGRVLEQLTVSPDGSWLVVRSGASLLIWDVNHLDSEPRKVRGGKQHFTSVAFHPSGRYLAATSNDTTVRLYDTTSWQIAKTFAWEVGRLRSVTFAPDGLLAAVGSDSGKIVVWDFEL
jgi:hypothetical protein